MHIPIAIAFAAQLAFSSPFANARNATVHSAPWMVTLQSARSVHVCSGSIIHAKWVVTAAHCLYPQIPETVSAGRYNLRHHEKATEQRRIIRKPLVFRHPQYTNTSVAADCDIGLVYVSPPFVFNAVVKSIGLPMANTIPSGEVSVFGWPPANGAGCHLAILQADDVNISDFASCKKALGSRLHSSNLCVNPIMEQLFRMAEMCYSDAGSSLTQADRLVGIGSWNLDSNPAIYVRTSAFVDWIQQVQRAVLKR